MERIDKYLNETFNLLHSIFQPQQLKAKVGKTKNHAFNNRNFNIAKNDEGFTFITTTLIRKGLQNWKDLEINKETEVKFTNDQITIYSKGKNIFSSLIKYSDTNDLPLKKIIEGNLHSISTQKDKYYSKNNYYRVVIPLNKETELRGDFIARGFWIDDKAAPDPLIRLTINNKNYHLFCLKLNNKCYFVIDGLEKQLLRNFQDVSNSILLAYAFLKGDYHGIEAYIFSYSKNVYKKPSSFLSVRLASRCSKGSFPVHSTSPHNYVSIQKKITSIGDSDLGKYMVEFPDEVLSKLCEVICNKGGVLRALILFVNSHSASLEIKIPSLFVALENITKVLIGGDTSVPNLIEDEKIIKDLKSAVKSIKKEISTIETRNKPVALTKEEEKEYKANFARINGKLDLINRGSNNSKLVKPFKDFNYTLSKEEEELIIKDRNKFLHGDDFMSLDIDYEKEFKELFHISMVLHRLIAVLLLKASNYSGYILNSPKIYEHISGKHLDEEVFIKI